VEIIYQSDSGKIVHGDNVEVMKKIKENSVDSCISDFPYAIEFSDKYDMDFWKQDIIDTFERIKILMIHGCIPYIMRHENYEKSPYAGIYINLARWCNQPSFFKKQSLNEYVYITDGKGREEKDYASKRYMEEFKKHEPEIAKQYFDLKYEELNEYLIKDFKYAPEASDMGESAELAGY
jgi:hypothetical protein